MPRATLVWLILLALLVLRLPDLFLAPRLWAEEGSVYLAHALTRSFHETILAPHLGYYSLLPTLSTALSPLETAPLITTLTALAWQAATLAIILNSRSNFLPTPVTRAAFAIALLLTSPPEVWLNAINAQHWAAVGVFVILFSDLPRASTRPWTVAYLAIAGLSGVPPLLFAIYFPIRWMMSRDPFWLLATLIAAACLVVQTAAFLATEATGDVTRFPADGLVDLPKYLLATLFWSSAELFRLVHILPRGITFALVATLWLAFALRHRTDRHTLLFVLLPVLTYALIATLASDGMTGGPRYGLPATALTLLALFSLAQVTPETRPSDCVHCRSSPAPPLLPRHDLHPRPGLAHLV